MHYAITTFPFLTLFLLISSRYPIVRGQGRNFWTICSMCHTLQSLDVWRNDGEKLHDCSKSNYQTPNVFPSTCYRNLLLSLGKVCQDSYIVQHLTLAATAPDKEDARSTCQVLEQCCHVIFTNLEGPIKVCPQEMFRVIHGHFSRAQSKDWSSRNPHDDSDRTKDNGAKGLFLLAFAFLGILSCLIVRTYQWRPGEEEQHDERVNFLNPGIEFTPTRSSSRPFNGAPLLASSDTLRLEPLYYLRPFSHPAIGPPPTDLSTSRHSQYQGIRLRSYGEAMGLIPLANNGEPPGVLPVATTLEMGRTPKSQPDNVGIGEEALPPYEEPPSYNEALERSLEDILGDPLSEDDEPVLMSM